MPLTVAQTVLPISGGITAGDVITLSIIVQNTGMFTVISDTINVPGHFTNVVSNPSASSSTLNTNSFTLNYGLASPGTVQVIATFAIDANAPLTTYSSTASARALLVSQVNDVDPITLIPDPLSVTKTAPSATIFQGQSATYTITVTNNGASMA